MKIYLSVFVILLILSVQLFCIEIAPIPWFDETFFASIAHSIYAHGTMVPEVSASVMDYHETFVYGPVYFNLAALSFKFFGFGIWQFRFLTLFFAYLSIILAIVIKNQLLKSDKLFLKNDLFWFLLILSDIYWNYNVNGGRMDTLVLSCGLLGIAFFNQAYYTSKNYLYSLSGMFWALAFLSSPRIFFMAFAFGIVLVVMILKAKISFKNIFFIAVSFVAIYSIWIWKCGGIADFIQNYTHRFDNSHSTGNEVTDYLLGNLFVPTYEIPLLLICGFSLVWIFVRNSDFFRNYIVAGVLLAVVLFYLFIFDSGPYSVLIIPFLYIIIISVREYIQQKLMLNLLIAGLFVMNISYFSLKTIQSFSTSEFRNPQLINAFIEKNIPKGSHVVGDDIFYYAVIKNGSKYQYFSRFGEIKTREEKLRLDFKFEYLIDSEMLHNQNAASLAYFSKMNKLIPVARLKIDNDFKLPLIKQNDAKTYACTIYKVVK